MKHPKDLHIEDYTYNLPDEKVARYPLEIRDASKLLVYKNGDITEDIYRHLSSHMPAASLLVFNQTKVIHARLLFTKSTGSTIEIFCLEPHEQYADIHTAMLQKGKVWWKCLVGGASKWKHGMVLHLHHPTPSFTLTAKIADRSSDAFVLELQWDDATLTFAEILHYAGKVPLPPYLHREAETKDEERYQTIFAREEGSVAAPTAGLHFTENMLHDLEEKGVDSAYLTLHVGAGTFKPVKSETIGGHEMHAEWVEIQVEALQQLIAHLDKGIIAVGTTSLRTLESLYWIGNKLVNNLPIDLHAIAIGQWDPYEIAANSSPTESLTAIVNYLQEEELSRLITRTSILIAPGYKFRIIKGLITNFHQPQSTLLLLIAAMTGENWKNIYNYALSHDFRFLSYGDGCLIWLH